MRNKFSHQILFSPWTRNPLIISWSLCVNSNDKSNTKCNPHYNLNYLTLQINDILRPNTVNILANRTWQNLWCIELKVRYWFRKWETEQKQTNYTHTNEFCEVLWNESRSLFWRRAQCYQSIHVQWVPNEKGRLSFFNSTHATFTYVE